MYKGYPGLF